MGWGRGHIPGKLEKGAIRHAHLYYAIYREVILEVCTKRLSYEYHDYLKLLSLIESISQNLQNSERFLLRQAESLHNLCEL